MNLGLTSARLGGEPFKVSMREGSKKVGGRHCIWFGNQGIEQSHFDVQLEARVVSNFCLSHHQQNSYIWATHAIHRLVSYLYALSPSIAPCARIIGAPFAEIEVCRRSLPPYWLLTRLCPFARISTRYTHPQLADVFAFTTTPTPRPHLPHPPLYFRYPRGF